MLWFQRREVVGITQNYVRPPGKAQPRVEGRVDGSLLRVNSWLSYYVR